MHHAVSFRSPRFLGSAVFALLGLAACSQQSSPSNATASPPTQHAGHHLAQQAGGDTTAQVSYGTRLPPEGAPLSRAYGAWKPGAQDTCPKALHDRYWALGPDGRVYPTWHPPTDIDPATGQSCTYGHEHGDDPRSSKLVGLSVPFGYVSEQLAPGDPARQRNEDHVGHKVFVGNGLASQDSGKAATTCDVVIKLHQGTHSADAFVNNLHEMFYDGKCADGTEIHWKNLQAFGKGGHLLPGCETRVFTLLPELDETPSGRAEPDLKTQQARGSRQIPDRVCADGIRNSDWQLWLLSETWITTLDRSVQRPDNATTRLSFNPYFEVGNPSRLFDPAAPNRLGRLIDLCYGAKALDGFFCDGVRAKAPGGMGFDDPRSPFRGTNRNLRFSGMLVRNAGGPTRWYSDAFGEQLQLAPDPARGIVIEQYIGSTDGLLAGPNLPSVHDHAGVHAPN